MKFITLSAALLSAVGFFSAAAFADCAGRVEDGTIRVGLSLTLFLGETLEGDLQTRLDDALDGVAPVAPSPAQLMRELELVREKLKPYGDIFGNELGRLAAPDKAVSVEVMLTEAKLSEALATCAVDIGFVSGVEVPLVRAGSGDVEAGLVFGDGDDRAELLVRHDSPVTDLAGLEGQRVGLVRPAFATIDYLETEITRLKGKAVPFFKMPRRPYGDWDEAFAELFDRKIAAVGMTKSTHQILEKSQPGVFKSFRVLVQGPVAPVAAALLNPSNAAAPALRTTLAAYEDKFNRFSIFGASLLHASSAQGATAQDLALWAGAPARPEFETRLYWHKPVKLYSPLTPIGG